MKQYNKNKFYFLYDNGTKIEPKNGDIYYRYEWKIKIKFPFLFNDIIEYELIDDVWVEQSEYFFNK